MQGQMVLVLVDVQSRAVLEEKVLREDGKSYFEEISHAPGGLV